MSRGKLLVVDDDRFVTSLLQRILTQAGYQVRMAGNGEEALSLLNRESDIDAVLLDRRMPGMDGLEVLRRMKAQESLRNIPVVLQTAMDQPEEIQAGLKAGALYYLVKPLDPTLVLQVVGAATEEYAAKQLLWAELEGTRSAMTLLQRGSFRYQTMSQCHALAALLAKIGPEARRLVVGLSELMVNALEHGNLGITYDEKSALIEKCLWYAEVARREGLPENANRWVTVRVSRSQRCTRFRIQDQGAGFPWQDYQELRTDHLFDSHGRGILMARWESFDRLRYVGNGNCVVAEVDHA